MKNVTVRRASGARARLPDNLIKPHKRTERALVVKFYNEGILIDVHRFIAQRLHDFGTEMDAEGSFWIAGNPTTDNSLWCLLRRDVESQGFPIPQNILRKVVKISFAYIRAKTPQTLAPGQRAEIVSLKD